MWMHFRFWGVVGLNRGRGQNPNAEAYPKVVNRIAYRLYKPTDNFLAVGARHGRGAWADNFRACGRVGCRPAPACVKL